MILSRKGTEFGLQLRSTLFHSANPGASAAVRRSEETHRSRPAGLLTTFLTAHLGNSETGTSHASLASVAIIRACR